jgi:hypothetical protein
MYTLIITITFAIAVAGVRTITAAPTRADSCYAASTVILSTSNPYRIKRVVTTGVRRYDDAGGGSISACHPTNARHLNAAQTALDKFVQESAPSGDLEHVVMTSTSPVIAGDHLRHIVAKANESHGTFRGVEIVDLKDADGKEIDELPLPRFAPSDSAHAACVNENATLRRAHAPFHWAC